MKINLVKIEMSETIINQSFNCVSTDSRYICISETDKKLRITVDVVNKLKTDSSDTIVV